MSTRKIVEEKIAKFKSLDLDEKLFFIYGSSLFERYRAAIEREEIDWPSDVEKTDEEIEEEIERGLNIRLMELDLTYKEMLFVVKATGILDTLIRNLGNYKQASLVLGLITDKSSVQTIQNQISQTRGSGTSDADFALSPKQAVAFFKKLEALEDYRLSHLLTELKNWHIKNAGK